MIKIDAFPRSPIPAVRNGGLFRFLAALALFLALCCGAAGNAMAEICWGKVCNGSNSVCCSGVGTCVAFNTCACDPGYLGKECGALVIAVTPSSLDFGASAQDGQGASLTALANVLTAAVDFGVAVSGDSAGDFAASFECPQTISGVNICPVTVVFTPSAAGARSATLSLSAGYTDPTTAVTSYTQLDISLAGQGTFAARDIVVDPETSSTVYAAIGGSGVYRSVNGGGAWTPASVQPADLRLSSLVIKPGASSTLFAGSKGGGVFVSLDAGETWSACADAGLDDATVNALAMTDEGTLMAGTDGGIFASLDDCASWTAKNDGLPE